jgi:hypothetical protein
LKTMLSPTKLSIAERLLRKMGRNGTLALSMFAAVTLILMNLSFGVVITNTEVVSNVMVKENFQQASSAKQPSAKPSTKPSASEMVYGPWTQPDQCPSAMVESSRSSWDSYLSSQGATPTPVKSTRFDTFAVAMIATGSASNNRNVERCVQSLRRRGRYDGRVVVITDRLERFASLEEFDDQLTVLRIEKSHLNHNLQQKMPYKRLKSEVLELMDTRSDLDGYTHVVYIDIDIVIGDRLDDFFGYVEQRVKRAEEKFVVQAGEQKKSFMMMFEEQGGGAEKEHHKNQLIWHSGVTVFHREHSRECLQIWQSVIDSNKFARDQSCLYYMYYKNKEMRDRCEIVQMDDKAYFYIPTEETMKLGTSAVFVHNTNTGRAKKIHKRVQYDYYRCSMMLGDAVMKDDILSLERKIDLQEEEKRAGLVWDGFDLKSKYDNDEDTSEGNDSSEESDQVEESEAEKEIALLEAVVISSSPM